MWIRRRFTAGARHTNSYSPQDGNILFAVVAASAASPDFIKLPDKLFPDRHSLAAEQLDRLVANGAPRTDVDPAVVWEQIVNTLYVPVLCGRATSDDEARQ